MEIRSPSAKSKGQIFTPDFMAALVVFGALLIVFLNSWDSIIDHQTGFEEERMYMEAQQTVAFLVATPGYPDDWDSEDVQVPGFAENDNIVKAEKLDEFGELEYSDKTSLLKVENFRLMIEDDDEVLYEFGEDYSQAETVLPLSRTVKVDQNGELTDAELRYVVWR